MTTPLLFSTAIQGALLGRTSSVFKSLGRHQRFERFCALPLMASVEIHTWNRKPSSDALQNGGSKMVETTGYTRRHQDAWSNSDLGMIPPHLRPDENETFDLILRKKIFLLQSRRGYRANTDSWVLAYLAWKNTHDCSSAPLSVLDLGSGHGLASVVFGLRSQRTASLCLIEFQQKLADRARRNMELNGICDADIRVHDVQYDLPPDLHGQADVVLCNPPFYILNSRLPPKHEEKKLAHMESTAGICEFVQAAKSAVRIGGSIFVIYDMMNFERLFRACQNAKLFIVSVQEVYHRRGCSTGRALLYAKKLEGEADLATPWVAPTHLHSAMHEEPLYVPEIEAFFGEFPPPLYDIGRLEYVGSPKNL